MNIKEELARLYPHLSPEQLEEVEARLTRYVSTTLRIAKWLENDPEAMNQFRKERDVDEENQETGQLSLL